MTVARGAANKGLDLVGETDDLDSYIRQVIEEAEEVLSKTPEMLPVLKEAGVVDSGGQGLVEILKGAYDAFLGKEIDYSIQTESTGDIVKITPQTEADIKFGYCTEFIIVLNHPLSKNRSRIQKISLKV